MSELPLLMLNRQSQLMRWVIQRYHRPLGVFWAQWRRACAWIKREHHNVTVEDLETELEELDGKLSESAAERIAEKESLVAVLARAGRQAWCKCS